MVRQVLDFFGGRRAAEKRGPRPARSRLRQRPQDIRRGPRHRDPQDQVRGRDAERPHRLGPSAPRILGALRAAHERIGASRNDRLHEAWLDAERRGTLGRVEHSEAAARPRTDIDETPAATEALHHLIDDAREHVRL